MRLELGAIGLVIAMSAAGAAKAQLAANAGTIDPSSSPYQQTVSGACGTGGCAMDTFSKVPAGERVVITHVSCEMITVKPTGIPRGDLGNSTGKVNDYLPIQVTGNGSASFLNVVNEETSLVLLAGQTAIVTLSAASPPGGNLNASDGFCTLLGYYAAVQ